MSISNNIGTALSVYCNFIIVMISHLKMVLVALRYENNKKNHINLTMNK